jgi:hypothetical protein
MPQAICRSLVKQRKANTLSNIFLSVEENSQNDTPCRENDVRVCRRGMERGLRESFGSANSIDPQIMFVRTYGSIYGATTAKYSLYARGSTYIRTLSLRTKRERSNQQVVNRTTLIAHLYLYAFGRTHPIPGQPTDNLIIYEQSLGRICSVR